jgi:hypothetical protein
MDVLRLTIRNTGQVVSEGVDLIGGYGCTEGTAHFVDLGKPLLLSKRGLTQDHAR